MSFRSFQGFFFFYTMHALYRYLLLLLQMVCCSFASILSLFLLLNHSSAILLLREIWWMCRKWKSEEEENRFTRPPIVRLDALISNHAPDSLKLARSPSSPNDKLAGSPFFFTSYILARMLFDSGTRKSCRSAPISFPFLYSWKRCQSIHTSGYIPTSYFQGDFKLTFHVVKWYCC